MIHVSVIIPTYGKPLFLEKSIKSVLNQTEKSIELIVVDDNNPDTDARKQTEKLLKQYLQDSRVTYIKHDKNRNGSVARNTGIKQAKGKYIAFLDSDDEYLPTRIEKCYHIMEKSSPKVAGVYTGCEFRKDGKAYSTYTAVKPGNFMIETLACTFMFCTGSNLFIRKSVIDEINGFDGSFLRHQDYEFLVRVFRKYILDAIPEILVIKNNENFNLPNIEKMIEIKQQYLNKFQKEIDSLDIPEQKYIYHKQFIQIAEAALRSKRIDIANLYYHKAQKYGPLSMRERLRKVVFRMQYLLKG